mgnify:CR=1 FL=1
MVGSPYQTAEHLAEDLLFIKKLNPHMIGIGPFIPHHDTPFADEKAGNKLLYRIIHSLIPENGTPSLGSDLISSDNLFRFQSSVIRKLAQEESCIIIGRCADYVLDGTENLVRIFVYAEIEERINKVREKGYFPEEDILKNIKRIDRERRDYYRYYTGKSWENLENYDLMINTTKLSYDEMVECVIDYLKMRGLIAK